MLTDTFSFNVASHFLGAIFNADDSGLDSSDIQDLARFEADQAAMARDHFGGKFVSYHWATGDESENFTRCEITGLSADCVELIMVCNLQEVTA